MKFAFVIFMLSFTVLSKVYASDNCTREFIVENLISIAYKPTIRTIYVEDGAADGHILLVKDDENIKNILACKNKAIPILIDNINNKTESLVCFRGGIDETVIIPVTVGFIAQDILLNSNGWDKDITYSDCNDDGLGACVKNEYYFRPDRFFINDTKQISDRVKQVKNNWLEAYKNNKFGFVSPEWYYKSDSYSGFTPASPFKRGLINDKDGYTNIRDTPNKDGKIIRKINDGEEFLYVPSQCSSWWGILNPDGTYGYMHKSRIKEIAK